MRVALINSNRKTNLYPIALLKLGAWLKSLGHDCQLFDNILPKQGEFDEIWITTVFTFDVYYVKIMIAEAQKRAKTVKVGGISASLLPDFYRNLGVDVHIGLHSEAEQFAPDYSLLPKQPEYNIIYTSRGCIRKCNYCMVSRLEPQFFCRDWVKDINSGVKELLFYDNNWLAKEQYDIHSDIEKLHDLVQTQGIKNIDFNAALDCRLMTEDIAKRLEGLPISPVRFAFDGMHEDGYYQTAVRLMHKHGFKDFMTYVLFNYKDTPQDFYYRLRESVNLTTELHAQVKSFPMRYQPILEINSMRNYIGKHWSQIGVTNIKRIIKEHSTQQQVSTTTMPEFEYWFGKDADEFIRLLNFPRLHELVKKKLGYLRLHPEIRVNGFILYSTKA